MTTLETNGALQLLHAYKDLLSSTIDETLQARREFLDHTNREIASSELLVFDNKLVRLEDDLYKVDMFFNTINY